MVREPPTSGRGPREPPLSFVYEPIQTLKPVAENIWVVDGPVVKMSLAGGSVPFPTRMTVVRLRSGQLFLHSPTAWEPAVQYQLDALGVVAHLISPNKVHYTHIASWKKANPNAVAWASPGVRERAASQRIEVAFDEDLGDAPPPAWAEELDQLIFGGSRFLEEVVFFHQASRTLMLADLIINFEARRLPAWARAFARVAGMLDPDGGTPLELRLSFVGRKRPARGCFERMQAWRPERIIVGHGRWYEHDGHRELERAFRWLGRS
jgi:Domain of unknown function (DUF4336)